MSADPMSRYVLRNVTEGQADVYDAGQYAHRGTVHKFREQPLLWGVVYPDGTQARQQHAEDAGLLARALVHCFVYIDRDGYALAFRTRAAAARFALLTY